MRLKKNKKIKVALIGVVILFVIWMFSSTLIISRIYNSEMEFKKIQMEIPIATKPTYFGFDSFELENDIYSTVVISGWVYCISNAMDSETEARVVFLSDDSDYIVKTVKERRMDIMAIFGGTRQDPGVITSFSPLEMKNGEYRVGLIVEEKGELAGFAFTDYYLIKKNGGIELRTFTSTLVEGVNVKLSDDNLQHHIDICEKKDETLIISGWLIPNEGMPGKQKILVEVIDEMNHSNIYNTQVISRPDVAEGFNNDKYSFAGFSAIIPNVEGEISEIRLLCEDLDEDYIATNFEVVEN